MKTTLPLFIIIIYGLSLSAQKTDDTVYYKEEVVEMPRFPGCEDMRKSSGENWEDLSKNKLQCANSEFDKFIRENIQYPKAAKNAGIRGKCMVNFIVEKDGTLSNFKIAKNIGGGCGEEAVRVINLVNEQNIQWRAGRLSKRKKVRVKVTQSVFFPFKEDKIKTTIDKEEIINSSIAKKDKVVYEIDKADTTIFKVVQQMPRFPGCEEITGGGAEKKTCADTKLLEFIQENIEYPDIAWDNDIQGRCFVTFIVEKDGSISNIKLVRDIGGECGKEALRIVGLMQDQHIIWTPGRQRGWVVRVQFNLPVHFRIEYEDD